MITRRRALIGAGAGALVLPRPARSWLIGRPPATYATHAVRVNPTFDPMAGGTPYMGMTLAGFSALADTPLVTVAFWMNCRDGSFLGLPIVSLWQDANWQSFVGGFEIDATTLDFGTTWTVAVSASDATGKTYQAIADASLPINDTYHCVRIALDTNHGAGAKLCSISIDGIPQSLTSVIDADAVFTIPLSNASVERLVLFQGFWLPHITLGLCDIAALWVGPGQYLTDDSKFISGGGAPVDLGATGALPSGVAPPFYFDLRDSITPSVFLTNKGSKGGTANVHTSNYLSVRVMTNGSNLMTLQGSIGNWDDDRDPVNGDVVVMSAARATTLAPCIPYGTTVSSFNATTGVVTFSANASFGGASPTVSVIDAATLAAFTLAPTGP